ncbi:MAG: hypothetical protein R3E01_06345 [Pirellulaceae bacterium]
MFDRTKDMFVAHWMQALILGAIAFGINIAMGIVSNIANVPAQIAQNQAAIIIVSVIMQIIQFVVQSYVIIIGIRFSQNVINRVPDPLKNIFTSLAPLVPVLLAQLVVLLITIPIFAITGGIIAGTVFAARGQNAIVIAAIIATVIPAVIALLYLTARVFLTTYFVVLRNNGPIEAIQNSFAFTQGNAWVIIGMNLILVAAMFVLAIPTCCIGPMLFGTSAMHFFGIITYLSCTGQWTDSMIAPR